MKEIGGSRYVDINEYKNYKEASVYDLWHAMLKFGFNKKHYIYLSSGRCAEKYVLDHINDEKKIAILPAFTCETVILPFIERGYFIQYYHIRQNLSIDLNGLDRLIEKYNPSVVLYHGIWGFDSCKGIDKVVQKYHDTATIFIEDRTLDLFRETNYSNNVQYTIGSFRKFYVVPDGGFVYSNETLNSGGLNEYSFELEQKKLRAYQKMYDYRINQIGSLEECNKLCGEAECIIENDDYYREMSPASRKIICSFKLEEMIEKRRQNYAYLYDELSIMKELCIITPKLTEGVVPYHFAITVENKKNLFDFLHNNNIFPSNTWNTYEYISDIELTHYEWELYHKCFFLEISDMYSLDDMKNIVVNIKKILS